MVECGKRRLSMSLSTFLIETNNALQFTFHSVREKYQFETNCAKTLVLHIQLDWKVNYGKHILSTKHI